MKNLCLVLVLFSFLSCSKEKGFIPEPNLNDPHYSEMKPELQWRTNTQLYVSTDKVRIIDDLMIVYGRKRDNSYDETIKAYHVADGDLVWEFDVSGLTQDLSFRDIEVLKEGQTLYFIDLNYGSTLLINVENGELEGVRSLNGINIGNSFTALVIDHSYYYLDYKGGGQVTLIKYDILDHEVEELIDLSDFSIGFFISRAVYHESDNILYFHVNNDYKKNVILALDLDAKEDHELWGRSSIPSSTHSPSNDLLLIDDMLIFESSQEEIYAVNRITGEVEWILNKFANNRLNKIFSHMGNVYIIIGDSHLISIDHQTGNIEWRNNYLNLLPYLNLHPDEDLLIGVSRTSDHKHKAAIYDLTNGQKLVDWHAAISAEGEIPSVYSAIYHEETNSIYLVTSDGLMKYNWPLP